MLERADAELIIELLGLVSAPVEGARYPAVRKYRDLEAASLPGVTTARPASSLWRRRPWE